MATATHYTLDGAETKQGWSAPPCVPPPNLANKEARSPTAAEIRERESRVERNRNAILAARVDKQKKHLEKVEQLKERKRKISALGCEKYTLDTESGATVSGWTSEKVTAPEHLSKKKRPSAEEIKEREALVESNRTQILASRVKAAKDHLSKVAETKQRQQEYSENMVLLGDKRVQAAVLPAHLEKRLEDLKSKQGTASDILEREARIHGNREKMLESRVSSARAHLNKVEQLRNLKAQQAETAC